MTATGLAVPSDPRVVAAGAGHAPGPVARDGSSGRYPRLQSPICVGHITLRNRCVMSPMATFGLCAPDGQSTERQRAA